LSNVSTRAYMNNIRLGMGMKEEILLKNKSDIREKYIAGEIYSVGSIIEHNKKPYLILSRDTNYVTLLDENYNISKKFIKDISDTSLNFNLISIKTDKNYSKIIESVLDSDGDLYSKYKSISLIKHLSEEYKEKDYIELQKFCCKLNIDLNENVMKKKDSLSLSKMIAIALNEKPSGNIEDNLSYVKKHASKLNNDQKKLINGLIKQIAVNEEVLQEKISKAERIKRKNRFRRTEAKRNRAKKIALHKRASTKTYARRARKAAIKAIKLRFAKKPLNKLSASEKERVEAIVAKKKSLIDRLTKKLIPKVRKIEKERLSEANETTNQRPLTANDGKKK
jgi:hypothetical protein